jgi:hypothetical protein
MWEALPGLKEARAEVLFLVLLLSHALVHSFHAWSDTPIPEGVEVVWGQDRLG